MAYQAIASKQAIKQEDKFTVDLIWWSSLRLTPITMLMSSHYLLCMIMNCGIIAVVMGIILNIIDKFFEHCSKA